MKLGPLSIKVDPEVPSDELWFMDGDKVVGKITGIGPTPLSGSVEIEPKPQDGRRLENRIMSMETKITQNAINFNHISECIGDLSDSRSALEQQIASLRADLTTLKSMHCMLDAEVKHHTHELTAVVHNRTGMPHFPFVDLNPEADYIADTRDFDDVDVPTPPQPTAAEGDEVKWRSVGEETLSAWERGLSWANIGKAAIDESIELGLAAHPINPEDVSLILLICKTAYENGGHVSDRMAGIILTAIAAAQQEASK